MVFHAKSKGRLERVVYLRIQPEVLLLPKVMITGNVANQSGVVPGLAREMLDNLDLQVIYERTDWSNPSIQMRLQAAHRCEILIPDHVPAKFIEEFRNG